MSRAQEFLSKLEGLRWKETPAGQSIFSYEVVDPKITEIEKFINLLMKRGLMVFSRGYSGSKKTTIDKVMKKLAKSEEEQQYDLMKKLGDEPVARIKKLSYAIKIFSNEKI